MITPSEQQQALTLRLAGYSLSSISHQTGIGLTGLKSLFKKTGAKRGSATAAMVETAKNNLLSDYANEKAILAKIAAAVDEDLTLASKTREACYALLEQLETSTDPLGVKARTLAAVSTCLVITQSIHRKALNASKHEAAVKVDQLPSLEIRAMTKAEEQAIRTAANNSDDYSFFEQAHSNEEAVGLVVEGF